MSLLQEFLPHPSGRAVLLSIKPKYADLILAGSKRVELRRSWAVQDVSIIVLYSSSPIQKIVGVVEVEEVVIASPTALWRICTERGGGVTRKELMSYFSGKSRGVAVLLGKAFKSMQDVEPKEIIKDFVPPQSFRYLDANEYLKVKWKMQTEGDG